MLCNGFFLFFRVVLSLTDGCFELFSFSRVSIFFSLCGSKLFCLDASWYAELCQTFMPSLCTSTLNLFIPNMFILTRKNNMSSAKRPRGSKTELTVDKMPLLVTGLFCMFNWNLKLSVSVHHCTPNAHSIGSVLWLKFKSLISSAFSSSGKDNKTVSLLLTHLVRWKPPLAHGYELLYETDCLIICLHCCEAIVNIKMS